MEIVDKGDGPGADLIQIAFADTREEAALMRGLLREAEIPSLVRRASGGGPFGGGGPVRGTPRKIFVRPADADAARKLLGETMVEEPSEEIPESLNARYLDEAESGTLGGLAGGRPRSYSALGAFARFYLVAFVAFALAFVIFLALH